VDAGGVVGVADQHEARLLVHGGGHRLEVVPAVVGQRHGHPARTGQRAEQRVDRERGVRVHDRRPGIEEGLGAQQDQLAAAVPDHDPARLDAVPLRERAPERPRGAVRVAVQRRRRIAQRRLDRLERRVRALVGGQLHRALDAIAGEHLGGGEAGLVAGQPIEPGRGTQRHRRILSHGPGARPADPVASTRRKSQSWLLLT
jgi:hypothetical protein